MKNQRQDVDLNVGFLFKKKNLDTNSRVLRGQAKDKVTSDWWEVFRADPLKCWFPAPLLTRHMDFIDELQAPQHVGDVIEAAHFGCETDQKVRQQIIK